MLDQFLVSSLRHSRSKFSSVYYITDKCQLCQLNLICAIVPGKVSNRVRIVLRFFHGGRGRGNFLLDQNDIKLVKNEQKLFCIWVGLIPSQYFALYAKVKLFVSIPQEQLLKLQSHLIRIRSIFCKFWSTLASRAR